MKIRVYPEGNGDRASEYEIAPSAFGYVCHVTPASETSAVRVTEGLRIYVKTYAEEELASEVDGPCNVCVEPLDAEALALPGWQPAEEPTPYDGDDAPRPFRLFVLTAQVEVTWTTREVQTFNPFAKSDGT